MSVLLRDTTYNDEAHPKSTNINLLASVFTKAWHGQAESRLICVATCACSRPTLVQVPSPLPFTMASLESSVKAVGERRLGPCFLGVCRMKCGLPPGMGNTH